MKFAITKASEELAARLFKAYKDDAPFSVAGRTVYIEALTISQSYKEGEIEEENLDFDIEVRLMSYDGPLSVTPEMMQFWSQTKTPRAG